MPLHSTMNARVHHEFVNTKFGRFIEICIERSTLSYTYAPQSMCLSFHTYMKYYCVPSRRVVMSFSLITVKTLWQHKVECKMNRLENVTFFTLQEERKTIQGRNCWNGDTIARCAWMGIVSIHFVVNVWIPRYKNNSFGVKWLKKRRE